MRVDKVPNFPAELPYKFVRVGCVDIVTVSVYGIGPRYKVAHNGRFAEPRGNTDDEIMRPFIDDFFQFLYDPLVERFENEVLLRCIVVEYLDEQLEFNP